MNSVYDIIVGDLIQSLTAVEDILDHHEEIQHEIPESSVNFDVRLVQACDGQKDFSELIREVAEIYKAYIASGREVIYEAEAVLTRLFLATWDINDHKTLFTNNFSQYLNKSITKLELTKQFLSEQNMTEREYLYLNIKYIESLLLTYYEQVHQISRFLELGYIYSRIIIMNGSSTQRLQLVQKAASVHSLTEYVKSGSLSIIIPEIPELIKYGPIRAMSSNIIDSLLRMQQQLTFFETNLREYQDSIKMDSQFYL